MIPFLTQFLWDLVGTQSQVNLYIGRGIRGLPEEFPFRDTSKAVLRKLGDAGVIELAKHLLGVVALADHQFETTEQTYWEYERNPTPYGFAPIQLCALAEPKFLLTTGLP